MQIYGVSSIRSDINRTIIQRWVLLLFLFILPLKHLFSMFECSVLKKCWRPPHTEAGSLSLFWTWNRNHDVCEDLRLLPARLTMPLWPPPSLGGPALPEKALWQSSSLPGKLELSSLFSLVNLGCLLTWLQLIIFQTTPTNVSAGIPPPLFL